MPHVHIQPFTVLETYLFELETGLTKDPAGMKARAWEARTAKVSVT
jgi:hypothetical protein